LGLHDIIAGKMGHTVIHCSEWSHTAPATKLIKKRRVSGVDKKMKKEKNEPYWWEEMTLSLLSLVLPLSHPSLSPMTRLPLLVTCKH
jgi:hypothetical protein